MLSEADIQRRHGCLGASDIARIITGEFGGLSDVVAEKVYRTTKEASDLMELGSLAEPLTLKWFAADSGFNIGQYQYVAAHESSLLQATCDAITNTNEPVEAKLVFPWSRGKWQTEIGDDRVADYAYVQVQTQMLCLDAPRGFVAVWFVSEGRRWFEVPADPAFQNEILDCAQRVWQEYVEPKSLPIPTTSIELLETWSPRIRRALACVEVHEGEIVEATEQQGAFVEAWERAKAVATKFTAATDAARDWIISQMGTAEVLLLPDGRRYQRSVVARKGYTVEPSEHVELREVKQRKARREQIDGN